jgi:hypothetical protein
MCDTENIMPYHLGFISDQNLFLHVSETIEKYRSLIDLKAFNKNIIDPIKLTFDAKIYRRTIEEIIEVEVIRQLDKSNNNHIGYFHQNIFKYFEGWTVPTQGYDVVNESQHIYVEMKNKHNTMNSSSSQKTYMRMQNTLLEQPQAQCLLVEVIAKRSQNVPWVISLDNRQIVHEQIRRVSIDHFYAMVTGQEDAFARLCAVLPQVIDDILQKTNTAYLIENTVLQELQQLQSTDLLKNIYLTAFQNYLGFQNFHWVSL